MAVPRKTGGTKTGGKRAARLRLASFLPYRLSVLTNVVSRTIAGIYEAEFGITTWQWRIVAVLGEEAGLTAQEVAQRTEMDKVAVSRAVAGLVDGGLMRRAASAADGRAAHLHLTAAGRRIYERIYPRALAYEAELMAPLSGEEQARLDELLEKLTTRARALQRERLRGR